MSSSQLPSVGIGESRSPAVVESARRFAALLLVRVAASLGRLAVHLQQCPASQRDDSIARLEFHCEAGASEGALFLDGKLMGRIFGVKRL